MTVHGKVAVVTGAGAGIGRTIARLFSKAGIRVVIADIDQQAGLDACDEIVRLGGEARFVETDVARPEDVTDLFRRTIAWHKRLDILVNNAAVNESVRVPLADCSLDEWDEIIGANLRGTFLCSKYAIPEMIQNPSGGAIVNMSSIGGVLTIGGRPAYCASKGGIIALTRQAALDYAEHRIRVNAIAPGAVEIGQWRRRQQTLPDPEAARHEALQRHPVCQGFGRMIQPEDVAQAALFLASDEAIMITGTVLVVDGGRSLL